MHYEIIETLDGRFLTILEVAPINYNYKAPSDKAAIINYFSSYTRVAPVKFRFKVISRRVDVNKYLNTLENDFRSESENKAIERYQKDYMKLVKNIGRHEGVERQFLLILEFTETEGTRAGNIDDIIYHLRNARVSAENFLRNCGNEIIHHENESEFVIETIYKIANKKRDVGELWRATNEKRNEVIRYYDNDDEKLEALEGYFNNMCAPESVDFKRDYCNVDNTFYTFLLIPQSQYPQYVSGAWMSFLYNYAEGVDVDVFVEKKPTSVMKSRIRQRAKINEARLSTTKSEGDHTDELINSLQGSKYLKNALSAGEEFFYVATMITISANSENELLRKQSRVKELLDSVNIEVIETPFRVDKCLYAYMPTGVLDKRLWDKAKRNMTTTGFSSFYPFASFEVSDDNGVLLGLSQDNGSMVVSDNFNTKKYSNANMVIFGTSGSGKTFTMQTYCMRNRLKGTQVFIIAPTRGEDYYPATKAIGGTWINISSGSQERINVLEIRPGSFIHTDSDDYSATGRNRNVVILNKKIESLSTFFSLIISDMSLEERQLLDEAIIKTYKNKGITEDNNSIIDHYELTKDKKGKIVKKPILKEMPILEDLYNELRKNGRTERLANILNRFVHGSASSFNGQTNVNLDNKYIVVDMTDLSDEMKPAGMFVALDFIWDRIKEDRTEKKIVAIDEAWQLISENKQAASFIKKIFKAIRGYAGAAVAATQDIEDFFALDNGAYGKAIINNSKIKFIFKLESEEAKKIQEVFNLSDQERDSIMVAPRGQALVKSNSNTFVINYLASPYESLLVSTDREVLTKLANGEEISNKDLIA